MSTFIRKQIFLGVAAWASLFALNALPRDTATDDGNICAVGNRLLIHIAGDDDDGRRATMAMIKQRRGYESLHIPSQGESVPRWMEWPNRGVSIDDIPRVSTGPNSGTFHEILLDNAVPEWGRSLDGLTRDWHRIDAKASWDGRSSLADLSLLAPTLAPSNRNAQMLASIGAENLHVKVDPKVRIAILDKGVAVHSFLAGSVSCAGAPPNEGCRSVGRMASTNSDVTYDVAPDPCYSKHATWMAGALTAQRNGDDMGIFPGIAVDSWTAGRKCSGLTNDVCTSGLQWLATFAAASKEAAVINFSFEPSCKSAQNISLFHDTLEKARSSVVAMGAFNSRIDMDLTADCVKPMLEAFPNVLMVTWLYGDRRVGGAFGKHSVSLGVPFATGMCTTSPEEASEEGCPPSDGKNGFKKVAQSSMATAVVSAAAAMVLSDPRYRTCTASQVVEILLKQADAHPDLKGGVLSLKFLEDDAPLVHIACAKPLQSVGISGSAHSDP